MHMQDQALFQYVHVCSRVVTPLKMLCFLHMYRKEPRISNGEFYEMLVFNFAMKVRSNTPFIHPTICLMVSYFRMGPVCV